MRLALCAMRPVTPTFILPRRGGGGLWGKVYGGLARQRSYNCDSMATYTKRKHPLPSRGEGIFLGVTHLNCNIIPSITGGKKG